MLTRDSFGLSALRLHLRVMPACFTRADLRVTGRRDVAGSRRRLSPSVHGAMARSVSSSAGAVTRTLAQDRMAEAGGFARLAFTHPMLQHEMAIVLCPVTRAATSCQRPFRRRCHAPASQTELPGGLAPGAATTPVRPAEVRRQSDTSEKVAPSLTSASELAS